jgi:hypothetical protein
MSEENKEIHLPKEAEDMMRNNFGIHISEAAEVFDRVAKQYAAHQERQIQSIDVTEFSYVPVENARNPDAYIVKDGRVFGVEVGGSYLIMSPPHTAYEMDEDLTLHNDSVPSPDKDKDE